MKNNEFCKIIQALLHSHIDGSKKKLSGWHIDYIKKSLLNKKDLWYEKGLEYFIASYIINRQIHTPWNLELAMYLKETKKRNGLEPISLSMFCKNFSDTPPEIIAYTEIEKTIKPIQKQLSFIPSYFDCNLYQSYDSYDKIYYQSIHLSISKHASFQIMVSQLFRNSHFKNTNLPHLRTVDSRRIILLQKLYNTGTINIKQLIELGTLLLVAKNDTEKALYFLNKALELDAQNIDIYFWFATISYYCFHNVIQANNYLQKALKLAPNDAKLLSFAHLASWHITKRPDAAISYLKAAIKNKPFWLLPRIQLAHTLILSERFDEAKQVLLRAKMAPIKTSNNIIDRYCAAYITGNTYNHVRVLQELKNLIP